MFSRILTGKSTQDCSASTERLHRALRRADAVVIGAGAGLSVSAGFVYRGERFQRYFADFAARYPFRDMYAGGFFPYPTPEEYWAYWSRYIWINRYMDAPKPVYDTLLRLVRDRDYFVLTTNVDHCFQKAGFDKHRLFYTQGDYGLFQCSKPCRAVTYDNEAAVRQMVESQGFCIGADGSLTVPVGTVPKSAVPAALVPRCPVCGRPLAMNLRADGTFAEDDGWHAASARYSDFLRRHERTGVLFLELGVGMNTPGIIKFSFWRMTAQNPQAVYTCLNRGEAFCPEEIAARSLCLDGDIGEILLTLLQKEHLPS